MKIKKLYLIPLSLLLVSCTMPINVDKTKEVVNDILENCEEKILEQEINSITVKCTNYTEIRNEEKIANTTEIIYSYDLNNKKMYYKEYKYGSDYSDDGEIIEEFKWLDKSNTLNSIRSYEDEFDFYQHTLYYTENNVTNFEDKITLEINSLVSSLKPYSYCSSLYDIDEEKYQEIIKSNTLDDEDYYKLSFGSNGKGSLSIESIKKEVDINSNYNKYYVETKNKVEINSYLLTYQEKEIVTVNGSYLTSNDNYKKEKNVIEVKLNKSSIKIPNIDKIDDIEVSSSEVTKNI